MNAKSGFCAAVCLAVVAGFGFLLISPAWALDLRIDFADNSVTGNPSGNWNTIVSPSAAVASLVDFETGQASGVGLTIPDAFSGSGNANAGQWTASPAFPAWIDPRGTNDFHFVQNPNLTGQLVFSGSGLDVNRRYRVDVVASRNLSGDLTADYRINGVFSDNGGSQDFDAYAGYTQHTPMTWRSVQPSGGQLVLNVQTDTAAVAGYLNAMRILDVGTILVDLGASNRQTAGNWNNIASSNYSGGTGGSGHRILGAIDDAGRRTTVRFNMLDDFDGMNDAGIASTAAGFPSSAQSDSLHYSGAAASVLQVEGLIPSCLYDVTLFASRQTEGVNNRTARYTVNGVNQDLLVEGNTANTVTFYDVAPDARGQLRISTAKADQNGYLGVIQLVGHFTPSEEPPQASICFDFGDAAGATPGNWNNVTAYAAGGETKIANAIDSLGRVTTVDLFITRDFGGTNTAGEVSTEAGFPSKAQRDSFLVGSTPAQLRIEGLDPMLLYDFTFFGSRQIADVTDGRSFDVQLHGLTDSALLTLNNRGNKDQVLTIAQFRPDALGNVLIDVNCTAGASWGYFGVLQITPVVPEPSSLALAIVAGVGGVGLLRRRFVHA
jgi:hypothetical protein